jgi:hypothetical protein
MRHYKGELVKLVRLPEGWNKLWPRLPDFGKPGDSQFDRLRNSDKEKVALRELEWVDFDVFTVPAASR